MKQKLTVLVALFICCMFTTFSYAATSPLKIVFPKVSSFVFQRAHRQGPAISLSWAIAAEGIQSYYIDRLYVGGFCNEVETVAAVNKNTHNLDAGVYSGTIHYKDVGHLADNNILKFSVVVVRIASRS